MKRAEISSEVSQKEVKWAQNMLNFHFLPKRFRLKKQFSNKIWKTFSEWASARNVWFQPWFYVPKRALGKAIHEKYSLWKCFLVLKSDEFMKNHRFLTKRWKTVFLSEIRMVTRSKKGQILIFGAPNLVGPKPRYFYAPSIKLPRGEWSISEISDWGKRSKSLRGGQIPCHMADFPQKD